MRARRVTMVFGLLFLGLVTVTAFNIGNFATVYHLRRLRKEPEYLREIYLAPVDTYRHHAAIRYARTAEGKPRLFRIMVLELVSAIHIEREASEVGTNGGQVSTQVFELCRVLANSEFTIEDARGRYRVEIRNTESGQRAFVVRHDVDGQRTRW